MARLVERAHVRRPGAARRPRDACRYCGLLDASVAAHVRAVALEPKIRTSVPHTLVLAGATTRGVAAIKLAEYPYIVPLSLGRARPRRRRLRAAGAREEDLDEVRDFIVAARTLLEGDAPDSIAAAIRVVVSDFRGIRKASSIWRGISPSATRWPRDGPPRTGRRRRVLLLPGVGRDPWLDPLRRKPAFTKLLRQAETSIAKPPRRSRNLNGEKPPWASRGLS